MNNAKCLEAGTLSTAIYVKNKVTSFAFPVDKTRQHLWKSFAPVMTHLHDFLSKCCYAMICSSPRRLHNVRNVILFTGVKALPR